MILEKIYVKNEGYGNTSKYTLFFRISYVPHLLNILHQNFVSKAASCK